MSTGRSSRKKAADYLEVTLLSGEKIKVHRVSESLIAGIKPERARPKRPAVTMETAGGPQKRPVKSGDPEYDEWVEAKEEWEDERDDLQSDYRLVLALRSYTIPDPLEWPPHIQELIDDGIFEVPSEGKHAKYRARALWLKATVLDSLGDEMEVFYASQELSGIDPEAVAQMREKFRRGLSEQVTESVGTGTEPTDAGEPEGDDQV